MGSEEECIQAVQSQCPTATIASTPIDIGVSGYGQCFCQYGDNMEEDPSSVWQICLLKAPTHSPTPAPTTLAPTAAPTTAVPTAAPTRACESGTFIDTSHPDRCQPCRAGRFSDAPNSLTCTTCSAGRVAALDRSTYCALCPGYVPTTPHNTCAQYTHTPLHLTNYCKISGAHILRMAWIRSRLLLSTTPLATAWIVSRAWYPQTTARHAMRVHQGQGLCPTAPGTQPRPPAIN